MEEEGVVVEEVGKTARVEILRGRWCGGCRLCEGWGSGRKVAEVDNPVGARKGQHVVLEVPSHRLLRAAFVFYILPVIFLVSGFLVGWWLSPMIRWEGEGFSILTGIVFLFFSFFFVYSYDKWIWKRKRFRPKITRIKE